MPWDSSTLAAFVEGSAPARSAGHWNHSFWWRQLAPAHSKETNYERSASPELKQTIQDRFGSLDNLKQAFKCSAQDQFGSGWVWLIVDRSDYDVAPKDPEALVIVATPNQVLFPLPSVMLDAQRSTSSKVP